jgi:SAM-dependent methyltransferase
VAWRDPSRGDLHPARPVSERTRIERIYRQYAGSGRFEGRWASGPGQTHMLDRQWSATARLLRRAGFDPAGARVLDIGASQGQEVRRFLEIGCRPERVVCLDLMLEIMVQGRRAHPTVPFVAADALRLPFGDARFDLVHQSVMVSSAVDRQRRAGIAAEMLRVTRRGGFIVWYDVRYLNPFNPNTRPIGRRDLRRWFPDCRGEIVSLTLIPPVARLLGPVSTSLCDALERIPPLRSHLLAVLVKP